MRIRYSAIVVPPLGPAGRAAQPFDEQPRARSTPRLHELGLHQLGADQDVFGAVRWAAIAAPTIPALLPSVATLIGACAFRSGSHLSWIRSIPPPMTIRSGQNSSS